MSFDNLYNLVRQQIETLNAVLQNIGASLFHVKPHGALYNKSARDETVAHCIASAVHDFNPNLTLFGLSESLSIAAAQRLGLSIAHEVFADRTYQNDGSLTPRHLPYALIEDTETLLSQVAQLSENQLVTTFSGLIIPLRADTICIHGDGKNAISFAKAIQKNRKI
jgi:UPF0271 protein